MSGQDGDAQRAMPVLDTAALQSVLEMIGADEPSIMLDLLNTYLDDSQKQVDEMQRTLAASDWKTLYRVAHSMKSSSATFGALRLSKLCEQLERSAKTDCGDGTCAATLTLLLAEHKLVNQAITAERDRIAES